ncbi:MAG: hypothetical protein RJA16_1796 [Planctomycetota bacterium]
MSISPPVLFFVLGMVAALVRSGLRIPKAVTKLMSLYLLWAIGFTGGVKIAQSGLDQQAMFAIVIGVAMAAIVPLIVFAVLRKRLGIDDAAAAAAAFGSVSAVTFLTAASVLDEAGVPYGGHMVAVMALMESPAIVAGVILLRRAEQAAAPSESRGSVGWGKLLHEAFLNGPVLLLLGSLVIGLVTRERGFEAFKPLCKDLFNGVLVFFLLDLGLLAARRLRGFLSRGWFLVAFGRAARRTLARRCDAARDARGECELHRGACRGTDRDSQGRPLDLHRALARGDLPVQRGGRHPALSRGGAGDLGIVNGA